MVGTPRVGQEGIHTDNQLRRLPDRSERLHLDRIGEVWIAEGWIPP